MHSSRTDFLAGMFSTWLAISRDHKDPQGNPRPNKDDRAQGREIANAAAAKWDAVTTGPAQITLLDE